MKQTIATFIGAACLLSTMQSTGTAQNVYKDYVLDKYAQYSPFDHANRGLIYKMQTGHAGWFGKCDDDRQKMVSPYIDWHCRKPDACLPIRYTKDLFSDILKKSDRLRDSAGGCVGGQCKSADCNGNCNGNCNVPVQDWVAGSTKEQIAFESRQRLDARVAHGRSDATRRTSVKNALTPKGKSGRSYIAKITRPKQLVANGSRSNDPRYGSRAAPGNPSAAQNMTRLTRQSSNISDSRFAKRESASRATAPKQLRAASVNSTPVQDRKADPQHFQFQLIGGSTNR